MHQTWQFLSCYHLTAYQNVQEKKLSRLVHTMGGQIGDAPNSVALDFDVGTQHLPNQRFKSTQFYYQKLVIGY